MRRFFTSTIVQRHFGWLAVAMMMLISVSSLSAQDTRFTDVNGQGEINEGSEYYIGLPNCWKDPSDNVPPGMVPNEAWVSSKVSTMVTVENKSLGINISYPVEPGKHTVIPLPDVLMNGRAGVVNPYGIRLVGNDPISVIVASNWRSSGAIYKALPVEMLGKKYAALSLYQDNQGDNRPGQILVVGTKDQTEVRWTLPKTCKSTTETGEGSVTLNEGETYLIQLKMDDKYNQNPQADLTGTIVTGSKPIGVITGHTKGAMPRYEGSFYALRTDMVRNMEIEMILPMEIAGTEFMTVPRIVEGRTLHKWPDDNGDMIRFVAVEDNTVVYQMRQNGAGTYQRCPPLRPGEFYEITNMEEAAYYTTTKPVVVGQYLKAWLMHAYEKKDASPLGHVSGGLGEMINVTPLNAWPSYATFRAPKLNNNYVNATFRTDDIEKIRVNGKTLSQFFGSKIQKYQGTDFSYAAKPISAGDYVIEGADGAKFAAYAYGNWETTEYPTPHNYAYGYPVGANFAIKCDDEIKLVGDPKCGNINGIAKVGPETSDCAGLLYVRLVGKADNYAFSTPKEFVSGDKNTTFTLNVIDPSKPATAVIKAMSRSGKFIVRTYEYSPEQIIATPLSINYGTLGVGESLCRKITLSNPGKITATVNELKIKLHQKEFTISSSTVFPIIIPAGESREVEVCATALEQKSVTIIDTVIAVLGCYEKPITELKVRTEKPKVYITDLNFGKVPVNTERTGEVEIRNVGTVDVKLTAINWPMPHDKFLRTEGLNFPIVIKPNDPPVKFNVVYNPGPTAGVLDKTRATFTVNTDEIKITSDWTGQGIDAGPYITGYDWKQRRVLDAFAGVTEYPFTVKYGNSGNTADLENVTITPVGADAQYFTVDVVTVPSRLAKNQENTLNVSFKPEYITGTRAAERNYTLTLEMKGTFNGEVKTATATLDGIGIQPHVDLTPTIDFGQALKANDVTPNMDATVTSNGTMNLTVSNKIKGIYIDGPDADKFIIDPAFIASNPYANPVNFNSGNNTLNIPIHFAANTDIRKFNAVLHIETDAPENPTCNLIAGTIETGTASLSTTNEVLKQFITLTKQGKVGITNTGSVDVTITDISSPKGAGSFVWKNLSKNNNTVTLPYVLTIGSTLNLDVEYAPQIVNGIDDIATIDYTTNNGVFTSTLTGTPDQIISLVKIGKPNSTPWDSAYSVTAGELTDYIDFNLTNDESENLDRANVSEFTATVTYLPSLAQPLLDKVNPAKNIQLTALTNGWTIVSAEPKSIGNVGTLTVHMKNQSGIALKGEGSLFRFRMASFLGVEKNTILGCALKINDAVTSGYTLVNNRPGKLWVNLDCGKDIRTVRFGETGYSLSTVTPLPTGNHGTLDYSIGLDGQTTISIYNAMGQKVATLVDQQQKAGAYSVAFDTDGLQLSSGTYTCKIESGPYMDIQQLIIAK